MDSDKPYVPPAGMAAMFEWVTVTHFLVIILCAAGAVAILWWGRHLHRRWKEAQEEHEADATTAREEDIDR
ncbi:hypothetical protein ABS767_07335 [Sphingomonas sp. ST-64]|uniref:Heme exporter protein D n=1 Tax=Sphingomonas plantiphila TaxID=3163295 RepID=A0ABW8YM82_9SPHN